MIKAVAVGGCVAVAVLAAALALDGSGDDPGAGSARPNVVLIVADDLAAGQFTREVMPRAHRVFGAGATRFDEHWVSTALCCPSRATLLTGQYAHNNGVFSNDAGYPALIDRDDVLPAWLGNAGYRTSHIGKYLNGHQQVIGRDEAGPGWDRWSVIRGPTYYGYRVFTTDGITEAGHDADDYSTTAVNRQAVEEIRELAPSEDPFFLQVDHLAPHTESRADSGGRCGGIALPAPRDEDSFRDARLPRPPSFNEADVSDKPPFVRALPRLTARQRDSLENRWRCALATVQEVDRGIEMVSDALAEAGELDSTMLVFLSDHGVFYGEHRVLKGKVLPYAAVHEAPLAIRVPPGYLERAPVPRVERVVANIDIAPTILDLAGATPCVADSCRVTDGRSLLPLIEGRGRWPAGRAILLEYREPSGRRYATCDFAGFRTSDVEFVRHRSVVGPSGDCRDAEFAELYGLAADPFQLENRCSPECPPGVREAKLARRLARLEACAGVAGRDPLPASGEYCE